MNLNLSNIFRIVSITYTSMNAFNQYLLQKITQCMLNRDFRNEKKAQEHERGLFSQF